MRLAFKNSYPVTREFGVKDAAYSAYPDSRHSGTDFATPWRTPLYAGMSGNLTRKLWGLRLKKGNEAIITNGNKQRRYGHMDEITREDGWVNEGDLIGYSGNTGYVLPTPTPQNPKGGSHLHDELLIDGVYVDVLKNLKEDDMYPTEGSLQLLTAQTGWQKGSDGKTHPNAISYWVNGTGNPDWKDPNVVLAKLLIEVFYTGRVEGSKLPQLKQINGPVYILDNKENI